MSRAIPYSRYRKIGELTSELLSEMKLSKPSIPIAKLAKKIGVDVQEVDLGPEISGMLVVNGKSAVIAINPNQGEERKRFTIAHELGHFILHKDDTSNVFVDRDFIVKYRSNKPYSETEIRQEQEANTFAASILMPQQLIMEEMDKPAYQNLSESDLISALATLFEVSIPAMTYRLTNLSILF